MSTLNIFDEPSDTPVTDSTDPRPMSDYQRSEIRSLFQRLDVTTAGEQFQLVRDLIGVQLTSVTQLTAADAQRLLSRLTVRVTASARTPTGNAWADRDGDTWIDKL